MLEEVAVAAAEGDDVTGSSGHVIGLHLAMLSVSQRSIQPIFSTHLRYSKPVLRAASYSVPCRERISPQGPYKILRARAPATEARSLKGFWFGGATGAE